MLEELVQLAPVEAVHGNVDDAALRARLPERRVVDTGGLRVGVVHDPGPLRGRAERLCRWFPGCDVVVYGHTHVPELTRREDVWILNPGSPTQRRRAPTRSLALLEADGGVASPRLIDLP